MVMPLIETDSIVGIDCGVEWSGVKDWIGGFEQVAKDREI